MQRRLIPALLLLLSVIVLAPAAHAFDPELDALFTLEVEPAMTPMTPLYEPFDRTFAVEAACSGANATSCCWIEDRVFYSCPCPHAQRRFKAVNRYLCCDGKCEFMEVLEETCTNFPC